jgi:signal transduction histidine kinase
MSWRPRMTARVRLTLVYSALSLVTLTAFAALLLALTFPEIRGEQPERQPPPAARLAPIPEDDKNEVHFLMNQSRQRLMDRLLAAAAGGVLVMTALSTGIGWLLAGRILRPVRTVSATARRLSERDLHERIPVTGPRDDMRELVETINSMLARLERAFLAQQAFAANASHELRGPITTLRALVEVAAADPDASPDLKELAGQLTLQMHRQQQVVDGLMALATSDHGPVRLTPVPLEQLVRRSLTTVGDDVVDRHLNVTVPAGITVVRGDEVLLQLLVDNLVRNAVRHNVDGGWIRVSIGPATITVENTGPPVAPDRLPVLTQPFRRGNDDRIGNGGTGLGLAIAEAVARSHLAQLTLAARPAGGLSATVTFPTAM